MTRRCGKDTKVGRGGSFVLGQDFDGWDFPFHDYVGTFDPSSPKFKAEIQSRKSVLSFTSNNQPHTLFLFTVLMQEDRLKRWTTVWVRRLVGCAKVFFCRAQNCVVT